ncbi:hypothetical protein BJX96DRAFT_162212 [Aspergillus floccosus]
MSRPMVVLNPEAYYIGKGKFVPNNPLPALVYRNVLPQLLSSETAQAFCEANQWEKRGEWGPFWDAHFHPNTHECYAIIQGSSRLVLRRERHDANLGGVEVDVKAGDVVVVPAGVSHRSLTAEGGYRYIGVYPKACLKWRNNWCKGKENMALLEDEISKVIIPSHDPVYGEDGPLPVLWRKASRDNKL